VGGLMCSLRIISTQYQQFSWKEAGEYLCGAFKSCDGVRKQRGLLYHLDPRKSTALPHDRT